MTLALIFFLWSSSSPLNVMLTLTFNLALTLTLTITLTLTLILDLELSFNIALDLELVIEQWRSINLRLSLLWIVLVVCQQNPNLYISNEKIYLCRCPYFIKSKATIIYGFNIIPMIVIVYCWFSLVMFHTIIIFNVKLIQFMRHWRKFYSWNWTTITPNIVTKCIRDV